MRYVTEVAAGATEQVYEAPNDGAAGAADSVIIGFLICSRSSSAGTVTVEIIDYSTRGTGLTQKTYGIADTIPLPADTSIDLIPGKLVLQHAGNNEATPVLTGDRVNVTSTQECVITV